MTACVILSVTTKTTIVRILLQLTLRTALTRVLSTRRHLRMPMRQVDVEALQHCTLKPTIALESLYLWTIQLCTKITARTPRITMITTASKAPTLWPIFATILLLFLPASPAMHRPSSPLLFLPASPCFRILGLMRKFLPILTVQETFR